MIRKPKVLETQGQALEDAFFLKQDQLLIEKRRALKKMEQSKRALSEVSGIKNDGILTKFVELGIEPGMLVSLGVAPLVAVAWADGEVDPKERAAVLQSGVGEDAIRGAMDADLLERWLTHKPGPELMEAWRHYVQGLSECFSADERTLLRKRLLKRARHVAEATGSFLKLTSGISAAEQAVLDQIEDAFKE
jgi:hypothetical protein